MTLSSAALRRGFSMLFVLLACMSPAWADRMLAWTYDVVGETQPRAVGGINGEVFQLGNTAGETPTMRLSRLDLAGPAGWQRSITDPGLRSHAVGLARDAGGNLIVVGLQDFFVASDRKLPVLAKFDHEGTMLWRHVAPPEVVDLMGPALDAEGNVYLLQRRPLDFTGSATTVELVKYSANGTLLWIRGDVPRLDEWKSMQMSPWGHLIGIAVGSFGLSDGFALDGSGEVVSTFHFLAEPNATPTVAFDPAGAFYVVRRHDSRLHAARFSSTYGFLWDHPLDGIDTGEARSVDSMGNLIVTGLRSAQPGGDALVLKLAPWNALQWAKAFGPNFGGELGRASAVSIGRDDAVYATGRTPRGDNTFGIITIKYRADGDVVWSTGWGEPGEEPAGLEGVWIGSEWTQTLTQRPLITALATGAGLETRVLAYYQNTNIRPTAVISADITSGVAPLVVRFSAQGSSDPDGGIALYSWNNSTSDESNPTWVFMTPGTYAVRLAVIDDRYGQSEPTAPIIITVTSNQPPVAVASASVTAGAVPLTVQFSSAGSGDPEGSIASYRWDFGNGQSSALPNPTHSYTLPGTYAARLTVTDSHGATATSAPITIDARLPPATVQSLSLASSNVLQNSKVTGTVRLSNTAGATVSLASNDTTVATVPASVVVPAGSSSATFEITTLRVKKIKTIAISATVNGTTANASLTVRPR